MADEVEVVKTKDELLAEMKTATDAGDWKAVSKVSSEIAKLQATAEKAERDAKLAALVGITETARKALIKTVKSMVDAKELDSCDGVWFAWDFGAVEEKGVNPSCRLIKGTARKAGGGGGGKKFNITTTELLAKHGSGMMGDTGKTLQQAYDADTGGNARYKVRMKLLRIEFPSS